MVALLPPYIGAILAKNQETPPVDLSSLKILVDYYTANKDTALTSVVRLLASQRVAFEERLLKTREEEAELITTALAYGWPEERHGVTTTKLAAFCREHSISYPEEERVVPPSLVWSIRSVMSANALSSLDSPIVTAWFYMADNHVKQVIILGQGVGEVRRVLEDATFSAALAVKPKSHDLLLDGLIWLSAESLEHDDGLPLVGAGTLDDESTRDALDMLKIELEALANRSALIRTYELEWDHLDRFNAEVSSHFGLNRQGLGGTRLLHAAEESPPVAAVLPIRSSLETIRIEVPLETFDGDYFREIFKEYIEDTIQRTQRHAQRRLDFHRYNLGRHEKQRDNYLSLAPEMRAAEDKQTVELSATIDHKMAKTIIRAQPGYTTGFNYYNNILPSLIQSDELWIKKMHRLVTAIARSLDPRIGGLQRIFASRLCDLAIRDVVPEERSLRGFHDWKRHVRPLLLNACGRELQNKGLSLHDLHSRRVVFGVSLRGTKALIRPFVIFTSNSSFLEFPADAQIMRIHDLTDRVDSQPVADGTPINAEVEVVVAPGSAQVEERTQALTRALRRDPRATVQRMCEYLLNLRSSEGQKEALGVFRTEWAGVQLLTVVGSLCSVGATASAIRLLQRFIKESESGHTHAAAQLPELPVLFLHLCAVYLQQQGQPDSWSTIASWQRQPPSDRQIYGSVQAAKALSDTWEAGYLDGCIAAKRILPSKCLQQTIAMEGWPAGQRSALREAQGLTGVGVILDLQKQRLHIRDEETGRNLYARLADALNEVLLFEQGSLLMEEIRWIMDRLLGAEHILMSDRP